MKLYTKSPYASTKVTPYFYLWGENGKLDGKFTENFGRLNEEIEREKN